MPLIIFLLRRKLHYLFPNILLIFRSFRNTQRSICCYFSLKILMLLCCIIVPHMHIQRQIRDTNVTLCYQAGNQHTSSYQIILITEDLGGRGQKTFPFRCSFYCVCLETAFEIIKRNIAKNIFFLFLLFYDKILYRGLIETCSVFEQQIIFKCMYRLYNYYFN